MTSEGATALAARFVRFLESGDPSPGLFTTDVFCDFTLPRWRLQAGGVDAVVKLRKQGHPGPGTVPRWRCDPIPTGFVMEVEERWEEGGEEWYAREMFRADVVGDAISALSVYCTGDWDLERRSAHAREVRLLRP